MALPHRTLILSLCTIRAKIQDGTLPSRLVYGCRLVAVRDVLRLVGEETTDWEAPDVQSPLSRRSEEILDDLRRKYGW